VEVAEDEDEDADEGVLRGDVNVEKVRCSVVVVSAAGLAPTAVKTEGKLVFSLPLTVIPGGFNGKYISVLV